LGITEWPDLVDAQADLKVRLYVRGWYLAASMEAL